MQIIIKSYFLGLGLYLSLLYVILEKNILGYLLISMSILIYLYYIKKLAQIKKYIVATICSLTLFISHVTVVYSGLLGNGKYKELMFSYIQLVEVLMYFIGIYVIISTVNMIHKDNADNRDRQD